MRDAPRESRAISISEVVRTMAEHPNKPVPVADEFTEEFWAAVDRKELVIQRCQRCQRYHHPPVGVFTNCLSDRFSFAPVSGRGKIYTYTITHDARQPAFEADIPYTIAMVELDEQPELFLLSNIPGTPTGEIKHGLRVEVDFEEIVPGRFIPQFRVVD